MQNDAINRLDLKVLFCALSVQLQNKAYCVVVPAVVFAVYVLLSK